MISFFFSAPQRLCFLSALICFNPVAARPVEANQRRGKAEALRRRENSFYKKVSQSPWVRMILLFLSFLLLSATPTGSMITPPDAPTVIIDVGHGGTDRGARAHVPYCEEKKLCLLTARLVKQYLDQLGYHVVMTRNTDSFIPLAKRVEIASQSGANIFVSVHFNSSRSPDAEGIEVFFCDSKENRTRTSASKKLADAVLSRVIRRTSAISRGVKKGNFYVIRETTMPAILVEGGFISNPKERLLLKSRDYQEKIARGIADGVDQYFKARWKRAKT